MGKRHRVDQKLPSGKVVYAWKDQPKRETAAIRQPENASMPKPEPKHVGGGWYELPSGERVRGKEEAIRKTKG